MLGNETQQAEQAGAIADTRQAVYRFLRTALDAPSPDQHAWMRGVEFADSLRVLTATFGVTSPEGDLVPADPVEHESRYLACFEVGLPTPPVPLLASHYQRREPVPRVIHEHILFYRRFRMPVPAASQEPADHLKYQLAFLIHLDALLRKGTLDPESIRWARRDFLSRHVHRWVGEASRQAEEKRLPAVYRTLLAVLAAAIEDDLAFTDESPRGSVQEAT